jgi:hypothetical protein
VLHVSARLNYEPSELQVQIFQSPVFQEGYMHSELKTMLSAQRGVGYGGKHNDEHKH